MDGFIAHNTRKSRKYDKTSVELLAELLAEQRETNRLLAELVGQREGVGR